MLKNTKISHGLATRAERLISDLGFAGKKLLFVSDEKIWKNCAKFFPDFFDEILLLKNPKPDEKNLQKITKIAKNYDLIIALGSGTINDLCKYSSAQLKIPYVIFASAPSMNGYLSKNASITISGHKKTLSATLPIAVFCDLGILKSAPAELIKAGIGDSLCFYSCWFDWYLSHKILGTKFDEKPFKMLEKKMAFFVKNFQKFSLKDEEFLKLLIEILLLSGQGMTIAGGSYPASQSEHMIAHTIEMKYPELENLHGQVIAVTTLTSARLQENLLQKSGFDRLIMTPKIEKFFGKKIASECVKEYAEKTSRKSKNFDWKKLRAEFKKIHFDEMQLKKIFTYFKIKTTPKSLGLSSQRYQACVTYAKFTRKRFTCLDLTT